MEINILEEKKDFLKFEIIGEEHTFCNALKNELWKDKDVDYATYRIAHPLKGIPTMIIKTKGKSPKEVLLKAVERLKSKDKKFLEELKKVK
jgi:DNA-directed RNA polymerase subunit L